MIQNYYGEIAALLVAFFWTITALAFESASNRVGSLAVNLIRLFIGFFFLTLFNALYRGKVFPFDAGIHQWFWLSCSGLIGFVLGDLFLFKSFTLIGSRLAMLIMTLVPPITAFLGLILLGEKLTIFNIIGMCLTFSGIFLAMFGKKSIGDKINRTVSFRGLLFALGGAFGQALGLVLSKKGMGNYDPFAATQIRIISGIIGFSGIVLLFRRKEQIKSAFFNKKGMTSIVVGSFFGPFLGVSFSLFAVQHTETGIASTIMAIVPILIIPPSVIFFRQRVTIWEIVGAVLSIIGVALFFIK
jgi:drug/metabolite transporter (DMT)-like permease